MGSSVEVDPIDLGHKGNEIRGYNVEEHPDGRVTIGPYTFSADGGFCQVSSSLCGGEDFYELALHRRTAKSLYEEYLKSKGKEKKSVHLDIGVTHIISR